MIVDYRDFVAAAGSNNSIGFVEKVDNTIKIAGNHRYLTSKNVVPSLNVNASNVRLANLEVRQALLDAIYHEINGWVEVDKGNAFLKSVARQLGQGNPEVYCQPLDRRTVRALVRATEAMLGHKVAADKMTAGGKALNAFFTGKSNGTNVPSGLLLGLIDGAKALLDNDETRRVDHAWVAGTESGESIHLQKNGNTVEVDCGEGAQFKMETTVLPGLVKKMQLALVRKSDLPKPQLEDILTEVGRSFEGSKDIAMFSGNSDYEIRFARNLSKTVLMTKFGGPQGLEENELRNVPAYTMYYLAMHTLWGGMSLQDLRDYIEVISAQRLNSEETLQQLDMYQKAAEENRNSVGYATERKAADEAKALAGSKVHQFFKMFQLDNIPLVGSAKKRADGAMAIKAMMADVISDTRTFLGDQHPEAGGRLRVTLQSHTKALAFLLCNSGTIDKWLGGEAAAFRTPLRDAAEKLLAGENVEVNSKSVDAVAAALQRKLAEDGAKNLLGPVEESVDKAAATLCTKMQYKMNHAFAQVFAPTSKKNPEADRYDELLDTIFDSNFNGDIKDKDRLLTEIDKFVDAFAKVGWSNNALNKVLDDVLKGAKGLTEANERFSIFRNKYTAFEKIAREHPESLTAKDMENIEAFKKNLDAKLEGPEWDQEKKDKLFQTCANHINAFGPVLSVEKAVYRLNSFFNFESTGKRIDDFCNQVRGLGNLCAQMSKRFRLPKDFVDNISNILNNCTLSFVSENANQGPGINKAIADYEIHFETFARAATVLKAPEPIFRCVEYIYNQEYRRNANNKVDESKAQAESVPINIKEFKNKKIETQTAFNGVYKLLQDEADSAKKAGEVPKEPKDGIAVQNLYDFMVANGMDARDIHPEVAKPGDELKKTRLKKSRELLEKLGSGADMEKGYGLFMTQVMKNYVKSVGVADQRAMLAAGIRFDDGKGSAVKKMGAFLKGAGPIMQKMLQGFASMDVDKDFLAALGDMKSRLSDIPDDVVKANLFDMVRRSDGKITDIAMTKKLGAASVGQAFLCTVTLNETDPKTGDFKKQEVVVKMLRPEAEQRAEHEKKLFLDIAKTIPGMERTFASQLEGILDELDLRKEAENTKAGAVYDKGGMDVKSMKLLDVIRPTKYTMVVEKAPGTTVDRLVEDIAAKIEDLTNPFYKKEKKTDANGDEVEVRVPDPDAFKIKGEGGGFDQVGMSSAYGKAIIGLSKLYEETLVQQKRLVTLASKWTLQGIYGTGFYHGDLHAGNIMVDDEFKRDVNGMLVTEGNGGLTVIDYGNATKLTETQQTSIIQMMTAATTKDTNVFLDNLSKLMSDAGRKELSDHRKMYHDLVHNIFNLGNEEDAANRIFAALQQLQLKGVELPGPIFKFSQCSIRLQGAINQVNTLLKTIKEATLDFRKKISIDIVGMDDLKRRMNVHGKLLKDQFDVGDEEQGDAKSDFVELQKMVDEKLKALEPNPSKGTDQTTKAKTPSLRPSQWLMSYLTNPLYTATPPEVCDSLMASMQGLEKKYPTLFKKLNNCRNEVTSRFKQFLQERQIDTLKNEFKGKESAGYDSVKVEMTKLATLKSLKGFIEGKDFEKLVEKLNAVKKYFQAHGAKESVNSNLQTYFTNPKYYQAFKDDNPEYDSFIDYFHEDIPNLLTLENDNAPDVGKMRKCLVDPDSSTSVELNHTLSSAEIEEGDKNVKSWKEMGLEKIEELNEKGRKHVEQYMQNFANAYEEAQKALLEDLKAQIAPICHKNKKGEVDARMVSKEVPQDFGDAVGHVILDNMLSSIMKNGVELTAKTIMKKVTGWNQRMKV